ncbi:uncharacterized protein DSM5745_09949 [Aspergillus mulundensis]|uniref:Uncharacterized protein n=1 Tax=Aspergillus mulundensis TaxID=1810919 RepID=A0A3D8QS85_9EURO|nr:Uncharacterized protein DSM5745_09949 [Aspergillus mulundensis]RDW64538.1 Uncharacterized protein DSM5745_09949 [Aspergillus mulundensis]
MTIEATTDVSPFEVLTRYAVFSTTHEKTWWAKTGPLLGRILASADYTLSRQLEALVFFRDAIIPYLGPYPQEFRSCITRSGLPLEFSVNYQQRGEIGPVVRIGVEPVHAASGTAEDRFNQQAVHGFLSVLGVLDIPGYDPFLFQHFFKTHVLSPDEMASLARNKMEGCDSTSSAAFGFDLKPDTISVKGYTFPALKCHANQMGFGDVIRQSVNPLLPVMGAIPSMDMVNEYMDETDGYSQFAFWSFDCVDPAKSRLKLYSSSNSVVWSKVQEIWTLGGRSNSAVVQKGLEHLKDLWQMIGLAEGHRDFGGHVDDFSPTPMVWNYEMKAGEAAPLTKFYFPVHGQSDKEIIRGLSQFLDKIGLGCYGRAYESAVRSYFPERDIDQTGRLTSWISFAYTEKTGVYLSVYYHSSLDYPWLKEEGAHMNGLVNAS